MKKSQILNKLIEKNKYESYLEIGVRRGGTAKQIICNKKTTVDPYPVEYEVTHKMTSDDFFKINKDSYDIIFVDGLYQDDQVYRDIINSLRCLNPNGSILVHDCIPPTEASQSHTPTVGEWCGTVWKAFVRLRATRPDLLMVTFDTDYGCGLIQRGEQVCISMPKSFDFKSFQENKKEWLNIISMAEARDKFLN